MIYQLIVKYIFIYMLSGRISLSNRGTTRPLFSAYTILPSALRMARAVGQFFWKRVGLDCSRMHPTKEICKECPMNAPINRFIRFPWAPIPYQRYQIMRLGASLNNYFIHFNRKLSDYFFTFTYVQTIVNFNQTSLKWSFPILPQEQSVQN